MRVTRSLSRLVAAVAVALGFGLASPAFAIGPGNGQMTAYGLWIGYCQVDEITVSYNLDSLMGEPTVSGTYAWYGPDCSLPYSTTIWLKVAAGDGWGYVKLDPVVPRAGDGFAYNVTGSPNWNNLLCGFDGPQKFDCFDAEDAKWFWREGYVSEFEVAW